MADYSEVTELYSSLFNTLWEEEEVFMLCLFFFKARHILCFLCHAQTSDPLPALDSPHSTCRLLFLPPPHKVAAVHMGTREKAAICELYLRVSHEAEALHKFYGSLWTSKRK